MSKRRGVYYAVSVRPKESFAWPIGCIIPMGDNIELLPKSGGEHHAATTHTGIKAYYESAPTISAKLDTVASGSALLPSSDLAGRRTQMLFTPSLLIGSASQSPSAMCTTWLAFSPSCRTAS
jgi:hypothetical protein